MLRMRGSNHKTLVGLLLDMPRLRFNVRHFYVLRVTEQAMSALKRWLCRKLHSRISYAGGATYSCKSCGEQFIAPWHQQENQ